MKVSPKPTTPMEDLVTAYVWYKERGMTRDANLCLDNIKIILDYESINLNIDKV